MIQCWLLKIIMKIYLTINKSCLTINYESFHGNLVALNKFNIMIYDSFTYLGVSPLMVTLEETSKLEVWNVSSTVEIAFAWKLGNWLLLRSKLLVAKSVRNTRWSLDFKWQVEFKLDLSLCCLCIIYISDTDLIPHFKKWVLTLTWSR